MRNTHDDDTPLVRLVRRMHAKTTMAERVEATRERRRWRAVHKAHAVAKQDNNDGSDAVATKDNV